MLPRHSLALSLLVPVLFLAGCGDFKNPFAQKPFVPTAVPADFVIVVDENHDTFTNRQHIQQVITANDSMSRTTYTNYRDYNDSIAARYTQETPLTPSQIQAMWNSVCQENVMDGSGMWINWLSDTDLHQCNSFIIQVRATDTTHLSPDQRFLRTGAAADAAGQRGPPAHHTGCRDARGG